MHHHHLFPEHVTVYEFSMMKLNCRYREMRYVLVIDPLFNPDLLHHFF